MTKRIVDPSKSKKDGGGQYITDPPEAPKPKVLVPADVNLDDLQDKVRLTLQREIYNLVSESVGGLLSREHSQSLVNYAKLIADLKKSEDEAAKSLSDAELAKEAE